MRLYQGRLYVSGFHRNYCNKCHVFGAEVLTRGLVSVGLGGDVVLDLPLFGPCHLLHLADLRHAEFGVVVEKHASLQDGQLVFGPVPELSQVLVVQGIERVIPGKKKKTHKSA